MKTNKKKVPCIIIPAPPPGGTETDINSPVGACTWNTEPGWQPWGICTCIMMAADITIDRTVLFLGGAETHGECQFTGDPAATTF